MPAVDHPTTDLPRCPHCQVDTPLLNRIMGPVQTTASNGGSRRRWAVYSCARCGGCVLVEQREHRGTPYAFYPATGPALPEALPERAKRYLDQARGSAGTAPDGAVVLAASAVDAMLKARSLSTGSLFQRINDAAKQHIITDDMAAWAHDVRLDANDQRHADDDSGHASTEDAARAIDFALALGEYLFVLPDRVRRGHDEVAKAKLKNADKLPA